jgi:CRP-like cAMP-binding protein
VSRRLRPEDGYHLDLLGPLIANQPVTDMPGGALLFSQGDVADRVFILVTGRVKLFSASPGGLETILQVFGPGDFFGLPAMLGPGRYPVSGETAAPSRLIVLSRATVVAWLAATPDQVPSVLALLGRRYERMLDSLAALKVLSPRARLCRCLLDLAEAAGPVPASGPHAFVLPYSAQVIGGRIGLAPENVSRAFSWLGRHGVVVRRGRVEAADIAVLRRPPA